MLKRFSNTLKAVSNADTMYFHEAMKAPDSDKFKESMVSEVNQHIETGHWMPILKISLPNDSIILPAIWEMPRKRKIDTQEVCIWKNRLTFGGHKMKQGIHFDQAYSPVVTWQTIRLFLILATVNNWKTIQVDFIMAYTQADINKPDYLELPPDIHFKGLSQEQHCLKILKNLYGGKESGRTWFQHLKSTLISKLEYSQSKYN